MTDLAVLYLLLAALTSEIIYIFFRNQRVRYLTVPFYITAILLNGIAITGLFSHINFVRLSSVLLLLTSRIYLKTKSYEKPDYRYLIILAGTILIHI